MRPEPQPPRFDGCRSGVNRVATVDRLLALTLHLAEKWWVFEETDWIGFVRRQMSPSDLAI